ncbi:MAG: MFS transporter, partial [Gluconacetobacter sp.]
MTADQRKVPQPAVGQPAAGETATGLAAGGSHAAARAVVVGILAAMAGLMFGLDTGVIAGALGFIGDEFHAAARTQEWIVSSMMAAAALGSVVAGRISFRL